MDALTEQRRKMRLALNGWTGAIERVANDTPMLLSGSTDALEVLTEGLFGAPVVTLFAELAE